MKQQKIFFKNSKGQRLAEILYYPKNNSFPVAIISHGYRSKKESKVALALGKSLPKKGIGLFAFDFSGNGESEGKFEKTTVTQYIDDLKSAIELISKKTNKIALIGPSLGGLISLNSASKDESVKTLILISPLSHFRGQIRKEIKRITKRIKSEEKKHGIGFYIDALKYLRYSKHKKKLYQR